MAVNSSSVYCGPTASCTFALLGSAFPMAGTVEASIIWKGVTTKCPAASNHSVKDRERSMVRGLPDLGAIVMIHSVRAVFSRRYTATAAAV
ncbi:hypothetical protein VP1G_10991 [Cytospora mali]|uniref:Uncharacterized protein n=1 Tax=Cytospora mali TaxID=578113 RepID=A0A194V1T3_CYTMA|nr:hypothetical protein VP1G_10991 [Valsa mali var. pyri (nom. inval.)]